MQFEELIALDADYLKQLRFAATPKSPKNGYPSSKDHLQANAQALQPSPHSPVYGVIFLFKYPTGESSHPQDKPLDGTFDPSAAESLFFASQTIQNACGTQALLSVLLNKDDEVNIGPDLKDFKDFTTAFPSQVTPPPSFGVSPLFPQLRLPKR